MSAQPDDRPTPRVASAIADFRREPDGLAGRRHSAVRNRQAAAHLDTAPQAVDSAPSPDHASDAAKAHRDRLLRDWRIVKSARFNAAKRLENKYHAGQFAFAISGIYGFLVPLFTLQFASYVTPFTGSVISFVAAVSGALSFVIAMLYQTQDFKGRAVSLHRCARQINNLSRHLAATTIDQIEHIRPFIQSYDQILAGCENHDEIDYRIARHRRRPKPGSAADTRRWWVQKVWLSARSYVQTYGVCLIVWLAPPLIGLLLWTSLAPRG